MKQLELPAELLTGWKPDHAMIARAEIVRLQAQGMGLSVIARSLNARRIPTLSGRGQWWPSTVYRFIDPDARQRWNRYMADYLRNR